jgi:hypothetical protein
LVDRRGRTFFSIFEISAIADGVYKTTLMAVANLVDGVRMGGLADNVKTRAPTLLPSYQIL